MTEQGKGRWRPADGERVLARAPVSFATGAAARVRGRRWFRDPERRDIQGELPGWPEGPSYRLRRRFLAVISDVAGGSGDPGNETEDFPVLWAAPGTLARTLPWELDPDRRPDTDVTHLVLTDRRLLVVGGLADPREPWEEVLWETGLSSLTAVERRTFSFAGRDFRIVFTDGSWCRLTSLEGKPLVDALTELTGPPVPQPESDGPGTWPERTSLGSAWRGAVVFAFAAVGIPVSGWLASLLVGYDNRAVTGPTAPVALFVAAMVVAWLRARYRYMTFALFGSLLASQSLAFLLHNHHLSPHRPFLAHTIGTTIEACVVALGTTAALVAVVWGTVSGHLSPRPLKSGAESRK